MLDSYTGGTKLAPGGLAVITGTNLGLTPGVTVGGVNAFSLIPPQFGTSMTIQIPWNAAVGASVPVILTTAAGPSPAFTIALVQYAPVLIATTSGAQTSPRHGSGVGVTTATPAAPGESITFYAIGLGPTNPAVNTGALAPNATTTTTTTPTGCCVGEDQIAFVVPDNVPAGCAVPMAIQIGDLVSNYAVIAIAPKGSRTLHSVPTLTTSAAPITLGQFVLSRQPNFNSQGQLTGNIDIGNAQMLSFTVPPAIQPFIASYLDDSPLGTCLTYNTPCLPDAGSYLADFNPLDDGPSIKVTGPNGSQTVALTGNDVDLGPGTFLSPGAYTFTGTGGANVGSINAPFTIPTPPSRTGLANGTNLTVTRANGVTLNWTGGAAGSIVRIVGQQSTDGSNSIGASFRCYVAANAGTFTVPPTVTLALPTQFRGVGF